MSTRRRIATALTHALFPILLLAATAASSTDKAAVPIIERQGYKPFGELAYAPDFTHFNYVRADAPKGGELKLLGIGTFDSLNPYVMPGRSPVSDTPGLFMFGFGEHTDSLLAGGEANPVGDEAGAAYGLIAQSLRYPQDLSWCEFRIRPQARFNDGTPITAEDAAFSLELLRDKGHPRYQLQLQGVERAEVIDRLTVRYYFRGELKRELPLVVGLLPVLPKHYWTRHDFDAPTLTAPVRSSPYRIGTVKPGQQIVYLRDPEYWGRDLPVNRGRYNFDRVVVDYYRDAQVAFEAFKTGGYDVHLDYIAKHWATAYDFDAVRDGRIVRAELPHQIAQGTQGFFFNLRRAPFDQRPVRQALSLMFDFAWTNRAIFNGAYRRQTTWFPNSDNASQGLPGSAEKALLATYRDQLPGGLLTEAFSLPEGDGQRLPRDQIQRALALLTSAGFESRNGALVNSKTGKPLTFEVMIYHNPGMNRVILPWLENLKRIGIDASLRAVDPASYKERMDNFDFDVTVDVLGQKPFPGAELRDYFLSSSAAIPGSRNISGIDDPVVDALVETILQASNLSQYRTAIHALDRVLLWNHYIIPHWYLDYHRLAWWDKFGRPEVSIPNSLGTDTWWSK